MNEPPEPIGREAELVALEGFLDGPPAALLVDGEAGIGKTTVWRRGVELARERSYRILQVTPTASEAQLAYTGLRDLLGDLFADVELELPAPQRRAVAVALLLEEPGTAPPGQGEIAAGFLSTLRAAARSGPILVAIDDLQWLDASSAAVLGFAARRLRDESVWLLASRRTEPDRPATRDVEEILPAERVVAVTVSPLSSGAIRQLLQANLGLVLPRPVLLRVHEASGGNPFYALELGRALLTKDTSLDPASPLPVPPTLRELVRLRLEALPAGTLELLLLASVASRATLAVVAAALGADPLPLLDAAVDAHVVDVQEGAVQFSHPLYAAAVYDSAPLCRRRELHRRLAAVVSDVEERAYHLARASEDPDDGVVRVLEEASERAAARGARQAAAVFSSQARSIAAPDDVETQRRLTVEEAEHALQSGDTPRARALLDQLLAETHPGAPRAEVLTRLARVHFNGLDWGASIGLLDEALLEAGGQPALQAEIELHLAINLDLLRTDVPKTLEHARSAVRLTERNGADAMHAEALMLQAKSELLLGGGWPDSLVERALQLEPATHILPADRWLRDYLASMRGWTDDLDGAIATLEEVGDMASAQGDEVSLNWALARAAELRCYAGRWAEALADIERGAEIALDAGQTANEAFYLGLTALVHAHLGSQATTQHAGERALELAPSVGAAMARRTALAGLGLLELSLGHPEKAHGHLLALTEETLAAGIREPGAMRFLPDAVEALVELGCPEEAEALLEDFTGRAQALSRVSATAAALRCRGLVLAAGSDFEAAEALLERVLDEDNGLRPFERARTRLALGTVQRKARQRAAARTTLQLAIREFEEVGAELWAVRAEGELTRIGGRAPSPGSLTPAERRIAELVAQGHSNKDVAAELVVTVNTVESALRSVYRKLGVHSRTEMARKLAGSA